MVKISKKKVLTSLLLFVSICALASPDRIGDEGGSIFNTIGMIIMCIIGLPLVFGMALSLFDGRKKNKDDITNGLLSLAAIVGFILFVFIKCS
jgi:cyanate permease